MVRLVPLQQTAEILWSEAMQGSVHEDQDLVVHMGRYILDASAAPCMHTCHMGNLGMSIKLLAALFRI